MASDVRIGILGPREVRVAAGSPVEVVGPRLRALLLRLALDPDRVVSAGQLVDAVWDADPPAGLANALQSPGVPAAPAAAGRGRVTPVRLPARAGP